ncbi:MAG: glycoside hydrolase family 3 protein [Treponema sp.]|nr:glycoside hydrolase family 3 protein [Treponema sp.]
MTMRLRAALLLITFVCPALFPQTPVIPKADTFPQAAVIAASLSDNDLAAQVLLTGIDGKINLVPAMISLLQKIPAGGILLFKYNLDSSNADVKKLLSQTAAIVSARTGIRPFMAADHEGGLVNRFGAGVQKLPSAYSFWELAQSEGIFAALSRADFLYRQSAAEIGGLGINMVLGPVAEILNDDNSDFLGTRSYGPDAGFTANAASVFIHAMETAGIACVPKHFPSSGAGDPHLGSDFIAADRPELDRLTWPFAALIKSIHVPAIMVSHVMVPAVDAVNNASLSNEVITVWLRKELGFDGIVIADDFSMKAVSDKGISTEEAVVRALNAGADMVMCWPSNLASVHAAIIAAVRSGSLPRAKLEVAVTRILAEKIRYGLIGSELIGSGLIGSGHIRGV